jgi:hypothetical protein
MKNMADNSRPDLTSQNLDELNELLKRQLKGAGLADQIPDRAHLFYGSAKDKKLTRANLELAAKVLLGMTLGYIEDAPLTMVYEQRSGRQVALDLSAMVSKEQARSMVLRFQEQSRRQLSAQIEKALAV